MIDIKELRRKVNSTDIVDHIDLHANVKPFLSELIDRLEAAEKAVTEAYRRGYATGQEEVEKERDAARDLADRLALALNTSNHERDNLRAKIAEMEKQEPVAEWVDGTFDQYPHLRWREPYKAIVGAKLYTKFYALPGAQPAPSVPHDWKLVPIEPTQEMRNAWTDNMHEAFRVSYRAMLAAAPEAKP